MVDFKKVVQNLFKGPCHDKVTNYTRSRLFLKETRMSPVRVPEDLEPLISFDHKKVRIQRQLIMDDKLLHKKGRALWKVEYLAEEKRKLYEKERDFQENFRNFNSLIIQNREKRERVLSRTKEMKATIVRRQQDIDKISMEIFKMKRYKTMFNNKIDQNMIYEQFLEKILYDFGRNVSCFDVINRYVSLDSKRRYATKVDMEMNRRLKDLQEAAIHCVDERRQIILDLRKQLTDRITEHDRAKSRTPALEILVSEIWRECNKRLERLVRCVQGIENLNVQIQLRKAQRRLNLRPTVETRMVVNVPDVMRKVVDVNARVRVVERMPKTVAEMASARIAYPKFRRRKECKMSL